MQVFSWTLLLMTHNFCLTWNELQLGKTDLGLDSEWIKIQGHLQVSRTGLHLFLYLDNRYFQIILGSRQVLSSGPVCRLSQSSQFSGRSECIQIIGFKINKARCSDRTRTRSWRVLWPVVDQGRRGPRKARREAQRAKTLTFFHPDFFYVFVQLAFSGDPGVNILS
jgi:hypothetical protein